MQAKKSATTKGKRRQFSPEFKSEAIQLAQSPGQSIAILAKDLGVREGNFRNWIKQAAVNAGSGPGGGLTTAEKGTCRAETRSQGFAHEHEIMGIS